jgi:D-methionine transport system substrate-binding protein
MFKLVQLISIILFASKAYALKVGVTTGPHTIIMEEVKAIAKLVELDVEIVEFNDFILPNAALASGDIDLNSYQHQPYLDEQVKSRGYKIISLAKTILLPMGIYSKKHKDLTELKDGATITIPNDPTNGGRALLLLKEVNFIDLKTSNNPTILDISANPKKVKIIEIEAPQIPRTMQDVDYAVTNTDWIVLAKINPESALIKEDPNNCPYTNVIAVRETDKERKDIKKFIEIYHSDHIKNFINKEFKGAVIVAW